VRDINMDKRDGNHSDPADKAQDPQVVVVWATAVPPHDSRPRRIIVGGF
jgi:hypothetical protein